MSALDITLLIALLVGNVLALPIWWWIFGTPVVEFARWCHTGKGQRLKPASAAAKHARRLGYRRGEVSATEANLQH